MYFASPNTTDTFLRKDSTTSKDKGWLEPYSSTNIDPLICLIGKALLNKRTCIGTSFSLKPTGLILYRDKLISEGMDQGKTN